MKQYSRGVAQAMDEVPRLALQYVLAQHYGPEDNPYQSDQVELAEDQLALACRELVRAIDEVPADQQPVGWVETG